MASDIFTSSFEAVYFFFFLTFIYLERDSMSRRGAEREGDRMLAGFAWSAYTARRGARTHETMRS